MNIAPVIDQRNNIGFKSLYKIGQENLTKEQQWQMNNTFQNITQYIPSAKAFGENRIYYKGQITDNNGEKINNHINPNFKYYYVPPKYDSRCEILLERANVSYSRSKETPALEQLKTMTDAEKYFD